MNAVHAARWLAAAAACDPEADLTRARTLVGALSAEPLRWRGAVSGADSRALRLCAVPAGPVSAEGRAKASAELGRELPAPAAGARWFDARLSGGAWTAVQPGAPKGKAAPFRAAAFEAPVGPALAAFAAVVPVAGVRRAGAAWTLELARPLPWPLFLRCDLSAAFTPRSSQLSLLLRDSRVLALDFDGEALWAHFAG